jgi:hypothetical protein
LIGVPYSRFASPTPQISEAPKLPTAFAHSQAFRQRGLSLFVLHSNETTRMIRNKSTARSAM